MSTTETRETQVAKRTPEQRRRAIKVNSIIGGLVFAGVLFGGAIGYRAGVNNENARNRRAEENAQEARNCATVVGRFGSGQTVRLSLLSDTQQRDCKVDISKTTVNSFVDDVNSDYDLNDSHGAKLISPNLNPTIQLPTSNALRDAVIDYTNDASDFNSTETIEYTIMGVLFGPISSLVVANGVVTAINTLRHQTI